MKFFLLFCSTALSVSVSPFRLRIIVIRAGGGKRQGMGNINPFSKQWGVEKRVLMLGLDAAGKTRILYLWANSTNKVIPTVGFNLESVVHRDRRTHFTIWDVGARENIRPLWGHYYAGTDALVWVIDAADPDRISYDDPKTASEQLTKLGVSAKEQLEDVIHSPQFPSHIPVLILCNKSELVEAVSTGEIMNRLRAAELLKGRAYHALPCSAATGHGMNAALDWLRDAVMTTPPPPPATTYTEATATAALVSTDSKTTLTTATTDSKTSQQPAATATGTSGGGSGGGSSGSASAAAAAASTAKPAKPEPKPEPVASPSPSPAPPGGPPANQ